MTRFELPEGRTGQIVAAALLIGTLCVLWLGVIAPLRGYYAGREATLADQTGRADHLTLLVAGLPALREEAAVRASRGATADALLDGATDGVAEANLQRIIEQLAVASGTALSSFEAAPVSNIGTKFRIGVTIGATCSYHSLVQLLVAIEQGSPKLLVDDLQIHDIDAGGVDKSHPIEASFTVYAFRQNQAAQNGEGS